VFEWQLSRKKHLRWAGTSGKWHLRTHPKDNSKGILVGHRFCNPLERAVQIVLLVPFTSDSLINLTSVSIVSTVDRHIERILDHALVTTTSSSEDEEMIYYPSLNEDKDDVSTTPQNDPLNVEVCADVPSPEKNYKSYCIQGCYWFNYTANTSKN
jgi:hypothetical protein